MSSASLELSRNTVVLGSCQCFKGFIHYLSNCGDFREVLALVCVFWPTHFQLGAVLAGARTLGLGKEANLFERL